jgi:hypothetical protein
MNRLPNIQVIINKYTHLFTKDNSVGPASDFVMSLANLQVDKLAQQYLLLN